MIFIDRDAVMTLTANSSNGRSFTLNPVVTYSQIIETSRDLNALQYVHLQLENLRAELTESGADHPEIAHITESIADSMSDAWGDSGANAYIDDANAALSISNDGY